MVRTGAMVVVAVAGWFSARLLQKDRYPRVVHLPYERDHS